MVMPMRSRKGSRSGRAIPRTWYNRRGLATSSGCRKGVGLCRPPPAWKREGERASPSRPALDPYAPAVRVDDPLRDREPQPHAPAIAAPRLPEAVEEMGLMLG